MTAADPSPRRHHDRARGGRTSSLSSSTSLSSTSSSSTTSSSHLQSLTSSSDSGNIRVVARIRPLANYELKNGSKQVVKTLSHDDYGMIPNKIPDVVQVTPSNAPKRWFELDGVFDHHSTQNDVYVHSGAKHAVCENIFKGFHCTILAYGQTGAGKTFTMGTANARSTSSGIQETDGVIPRACHDLFENIQTKCDGNASVELSYLEIYNEEIRDLLVDEQSKSSAALKIRETLNGEVYVSGLESRLVKTTQDIGRIMEEAGNRRVTASTAMNAVSSRSHAICILKVQGVLEDSSKFQAKLTLVDLAGSERIKKTGAQGNRRMEGININKGLFVLGQVVSALAEQGRQQPSNRKSARTARMPPYRDSKLTRLLQDSLGGNSRTIMVACVSPADFNLDESVNTLRYATSARNIKNTATRNVMKSISPEEAAKLQRQNELLKVQIQELQDTIKKLTLEVENASLASTESDEDDSFSLQNCEVDTSQHHVELTAATERIKELEAQVESLKKSLKRTKADLRKSMTATAIELPAMKVQVAHLREEVEVAEIMEAENQELLRELDEAKADAASARLAARELSDIVERLSRQLKGTNNQEKTNENLCNQLTTETDIVEPQQQTIENGRNQFLPMEAWDVFLVKFGFLYICLGLLAAFLVKMFGFKDVSMQIYTILFVQSTILYYVLQNPEQIKF